MNVVERLDALEKQVRELKDEIKAIKNKNMVRGGGAITLHNASLDVDRTVRISDILNRLEKLES